ncbi:MAG: branched-chain amino acid ABC transporter permease [bacterium]
MTFAMRRVVFAISLLAGVAIYVYALGSGYTRTIVIYAGINVILAVSLNLINGITGQFSIGHGGFMAIGAYSSAAFTVYFGGAFASILGRVLPDIVVSKIVFLAAIILGAVCAAIAGLIIGIPTLRLRGDYLAIATLGMGEIIRVVFFNMNVVGGARGFPGIPPYTNLFWIWGIMIICIAVVVNITNSSYGRALLSIREDEVAAATMGIDTTRYKVMAFVIGAGFAGVAGVLFAHHLMFISPAMFSFFISVNVIIMLVLGGMGSTTGAVIGAVIFTILSELLRGAMPIVGDGINALIGFMPPSLKEVDFIQGTLINMSGNVAALRIVFFSVLLIALMIRRPQGILGQREVTIAGILRWLGLGGSSGRARDEG